MSDVREPEAATGGEAGSRQHGAFIWYELITPDPEGAKAFYDSVVGWSIGERAPVAHDYRIIGRGDGGHAGGVLRLTDEMRQSGMKPVWLGYVGVEDVDATIARIEAKSGKTLVPPFDIEVGRIAMVADPEGNPFYVMKPVPPAGQEQQQSDVFSATAEQRVSWNELSTTDPAAARAFYGELFGWGSDEFMDMGAFGEYRFIDFAGERLGAMYHPRNEGAAAKQDTGWRYYIRVPSISAAATAVTAGGGQVAMGPHQVPTGDHIIIGKDPQGAEFALVGKL